MPTWRPRYVPTPLGVIRATPPQLPEPDAETTFEPLRDDEDQPPPEATIVNAAIYENGHKVKDAGSIADAWRELRHHPHHERHGRPHDLGSEHGHPSQDPLGPGQLEHGRRMAWIGMTQPTPRQLQQVAQIFDLHPLAVEDAIVAHQRPKLERYNETLFVVLRPATYDDETETVKFGEIHAFIGPDFVITVRHTAQPVLLPVRQRFEGNSDLLARGPQAVLYGLLDFIVDGYAPVAAGLENDIDEIETQVFESDPTVSRRIYELSQEVMELQRAVKPLQIMLRGLEAGAAKYGTDDEIINALRDVRDHITSIVERNDGFRQSLSEILQLNAILVAQTQNEEMKRLAEVANNQADEVKRASSWAAILFAPTIVAGAYGMNFDRMPELHWAFGYPFALLLMVAVSFGMWIMFKRKNWL